MIGDAGEASLGLNTEESDKPDSWLTIDQNLSDWEERKLL